MILEEYIKVNVNSKNFSYYKNLGYPIEHKGVYLIKNEDLSKGSNTKEKNKM